LRTRRAFALAIVAATAEAVLASWLILGSDSAEESKGVTAVIAVTAGLLYIGSGLIAIRRRPENRTGLYLASVGYLWLFGALPFANNDAVYTVGALFSNLAFIPFALLVLAFPTGRLQTRVDRQLVGWTVGCVTLGPLLTELFSRQPPWCGDLCRDSVILVYESKTITTIVDWAFTAVALGLILAVVVVLVQRWRWASQALRRLLGPVYLAGVAALVVLFLQNLLAKISMGAAEALSPLFLLLFAAVPFAFLVGILRSRLARGSVADLAVAIREGAPLRDAISTALNDPSLALAFWIEPRHCFVDRDGRPLTVDGAATIVERDGRRVGALLHDESLRNEPELVESVAATVALALDNERLQAELRAQNDFLTTILEAAPSLLVVVDTEAKIRVLNAATLEAAGFDDREVVRGQYFWDVFIDREEREAMQARFRAAAPDHPPAEYENTFTNARGKRMSVIWRGVPVVDETGRVESIVAAGLDVTSHRRQEEEIRASRARIVAAGDDARRRLERNLHDGAQQRLVSLSLALRLAQSKLGSDPGAVGEILAGASDELAQALEELRELARGIHPAVLTDRGLGAALEGLAARTPIPVEITPLAERLPEPIEAAAYYVISESIANVVKHAEAGSVDVRLWRRDGVVVIEVADDGIGGADSRVGSGLRGLADRVAALDGTLRVESPPSRGTVVVAEIPLPATTAAE
jgi:PAS domain S-box-containing protein